MKLLKTPKKKINLENYIRNLFFAKDLFIKSIQENVIGFPITICGWPK